MYNVKVISNEVVDQTKNRWNRPQITICVKNMGAKNTFKKNMSLIKTIGRFGPRQINEIVKRQNKVHSVSWWYTLSHNKANGETKLSKNLTSARCGGKNYQTERGRY